MITRNKLLISGLAFCLMAETGLAAPIVGSVSDTYWGSNNNGHGDVIGQESKFEIFGIDYSLDGTSLEIVVNTNFANNGLGSYSSYTQADPNGDAGQGISFGDLFLAASWNPYDDPNTSADDLNYKYDDMYNGTDWDYGFSLTNRYAAGGNGAWYDLTGLDNASSIFESDDFMTGNATWRNGQAVAVDRSATGLENLLYATTWDVNGGSPGKITFNFDISGTTLESSDTIAFHWAMSCGNDTIEGFFDKPVSTPEPGTLALFAIGLLGLLRLRKTPVRITV